MICTRCWRKIPINARFCDHCGLKTDRILRIRMILGAIILIGQVQNGLFILIMTLRIPGSVQLLFILASVASGAFGAYLLWSAWRYRHGLNASVASA